MVCQTEGRFEDVLEYDGCGSHGSYYWEIDHDPQQGHGMDDRVQHDGQHDSKRDRYGHRTYDVENRNPECVPEVIGLEHLRVVAEPHELHGGHHVPFLETDEERHPHRREDEERENERGRHDEEPALQIVDPTSTAHRCSPRSRDTGPGYLPRAQPSST